MDRHISVFSFTTRSGVFADSPRDNPHMWIHINYALMVNQHTRYHVYCTLMLNQCNVVRSNTLTVKHTCSTTLMKYISDMYNELS